MRIYRLIDWMDKLNVRVVSTQITLDELNDYDNAVNNEKLLVTKNSLFVELKIMDYKEPWLIALDLDTAKVVALPWWYFREADL